MTLTLPTEATKPVTELGKQTILIYSAPKLGKSTWASHLPSAIFFECEPGLNHLEVFRVPTYKWEDFLEACKLIAKGDPMLVVLAALVLVPLSEALRSNLITDALIKSGIVAEESKIGFFLKEHLSHAHVLIYGILVVIVMLYMPDGILGFGRKLAAKRRKG